ncbi:hypothetical protein PILCRDRAFT_1246 [Piloderma croceum F 1598]|uniref:DUF6593 domain-containing protein n=1 Tax=Piloderma croceum (strain F 1598) TaxID=765440 RepID=A0A0C3GK72_PILCF|nr:hypothetical protein PILCRDRAFT_1246 [Piloderma croceum F 1598]
MADILLRIAYHFPNGSDFLHPITIDPRMNTTFYRMNLNTRNYETAGFIEWSAGWNARVTWGIETVSLRDCRKKKKEASKSRRFKAGDSEYKWKIAENERDLFCVDSWNRTIASWSQDTLTLRVASRAANILDRLIVTCTLNLYMKQLGQW